MQKKLIIKLRRDRVLLAWGIGGLIFSALLLVYMHTTPWAVKQYASIIKSPKFFPNIGIYGLLVMSAVLVATALGQTRKIKSGNAAAPNAVELNIYGLIMIAIWAGFIFLNNILYRSTHIISYLSYFRFDCILVYRDYCETVVCITILVIKAAFPCRGSVSTNVSFSTSKPPISASNDLYRWE